MSVQTYPDEAAIRHVGEGLRAASLSEAEWTHGAHFAAALWVVACCPDLVAERAMPALIRRLNEALGGTNSDTAGYHETITQASLRAVRAHLAGEPNGTPLHEAHARLMAGPLGRSDWLLGYWSRERLFTPEARRAWVEPDLMALPF